MVLLVCVRVKINMPIIGTQTNYNPTTRKRINTRLVIKGTEISFGTSSLVIPYWVSINKFYRIQKSLNNNVF